LVALQTLSAMGNNEGALEDILTAERYIPDTPEERANIENMKGMLYNKLQDYAACEASFRVRCARCICLGSAAHCPSYTGQGGVE
jgi:hypothetical protein